MATANHDLPPTRLLREWAPGWHDNTYSKWKGGCQPPPFKLFLLMERRIPLHPDPADPQRWSVQRVFAGLVKARREWLRRHRGEE